MGITASKNLDDQRREKVSVDQKAKEHQGGIDQA